MSQETILLEKHHRDDLAHRETFKKSNVEYRTKDYVLAGENYKVFMPVEILKGIEFTEGLLKRTERRARKADRLNKAVKNMDFWARLKFLFTGQLPKVSGAAMPPDHPNCRSTM